jgi:hypothetical protein
LQRVTCDLRTLDSVGNRGVSDRHLGQRRFGSAATECLLLCSAACFELRGLFVLQLHERLRRLCDRVDQPVVVRAQMRKRRNLTGRWQPARRR